jgi:hypothetical protein
LAAAATAALAAAATAAPVEAAIAARAVQIETLVAVTVPLPHAI